MVRRTTRLRPRRSPRFRTSRTQVAAADLEVPINLFTREYDVALAGSLHVWDDYAVGEKIDHVDAMTSRGSRAYDCHAALSEYGEGTFR